MADIQARTEATTWRVGILTSSSTTLTNMRGRKQTRKEMKMVNIILVRRRSSFLWDEATQFSLEAAVGPELSWCFWTLSLRVIICMNSSLSVCWPHLLCLTL